MDVRRRTIPRSARKSTVSDTRPAAPTTPQKGYAPVFDTGSALPPLRTGVEAISPVTVEPAVCYGSAPQTAVAWLPDALTAGNRAVAVVGSGDGGPSADLLSYYHVHVDKDSVVATMANSISHPGKVRALAIAGDLLVAGSSDGTLRIVMDDRLQDVTSLDDPIAAVCAANGQLCAFSSGGVLAVTDVETQNTEETRAQSVGFRAACTSGAQVVSAGSTGEIDVWDLREMNVRQKLKCTAKCARPLCVASDAAQPHIVVAGLASGELCMWDRRNEDTLPVSRVQLHDGYMWDVNVVDSRAGLLLSAGEDSDVWLMDFGAAATRSAGDASEHWRAQITQSDVRNVAAQNKDPVNAVAAHPVADLYAFASDSAAVTFGTLYN